MALSSYDATEAPPSSSTSAPRSTFSMSLLNSDYTAGESYHAKDATPGSDLIKRTIHEETVAELLASDWGRTVPESYGRMDLQHALLPQDWPLHCSKDLEGFQEPIVVLPLVARSVARGGGACVFLLFFIPLYD